MITINVTLSRPFVTTSWSITTTFLSTIKRGLMSSLSESFIIRAIFLLSRLNSS